MPELKDLKITEESPEAGETPVQPALEAVTPPTLEKPAKNVFKPVPEPHYARLAGADWDDDKKDELGELIEGELKGRWMGKARSYGYGKQEAEDIVSSFSTKIFDKLIERYKPAPEKTKFIPYLFRSFRNHLFEDGRRRARSVETDLEEHHLTEQVVHIDFDLREKERLIRKALASLPAKQNQALHLRIQELSYEDIARRMGITEGYARVLVHTARQTLRKTLEKDGFYV